MPHQPFPKGNTIGRPFEKGRSGNPGGRAKGVERTWREFLAETVGDETRRRLLMERAYDLAMGGDVAAMRFVFERADGKPKESIDLNLGGPSQEQTQQILDALRMTPQQRRDALDGQDTTEHAEPIGD